MWLRSTDSKFPPKKYASVFTHSFVILLQFNSSWREVTKGESVQLRTIQRSNIRDFVFSSSGQIKLLYWLFIIVSQWLKQWHLVYAEWGQIKPTFTKIWLKSDRLELLLLWLQKGLTESQQPTFSTTKLRVLLLLYHYFCSLKLNPSFTQSYQKKFVQLSWFVLTD